jgi:hypothetical protein
MVEPSSMCRKHLLGEHVELHMMVASLRKKRKLDGFFRTNCIEIKSIESRHNKIVVELHRRGYNHKTDLLCGEQDYSYLPLEQQEYKIDVNKSLSDLTTRCTECMERNKLHANHNH